MLPYLVYAILGFPVFWASKLPLCCLLSPSNPPSYVSWSNSSLSLLLHHWTYSGWEEAIVEGGRGGILCTVLEDSSDFQGSG